MLHTLKKNFARFKQPLLSNNVPNGEFSDLRQRLSSIKVSLKYTLSMLNSANRIWVLQIQQQRQFSEKFHEAYPCTEDDTYTVAKYFADESQALYQAFLQENSTSSSSSNNTPHRNSHPSSSNDDENNPMIVYTHILSEIRRYVAEIEGVESMYNSLLEVRSEKHRYQAKVDTIQQSSPTTVRSNRRPVEETKRQRNIQKLGAVSEEYNKRLEETVARQKKVYMKYPVVFKAALTAYWLSHQKHVTALIHSLEKTQKFATTYEEQMRKLDVASLTEDQIMQLCAVDTSLVLQNGNIDTSQRSLRNNMQDISRNIQTNGQAKPITAQPTQSPEPINNEQPSAAASTSKEREEEIDEDLFMDPQTAFPDQMDGKETAWSPVSEAGGSFPSPTVDKTATVAKQEKSSSPPEQNSATA